MKQETKSFIGFIVTLLIMIILYTFIIVQFIGCVHFPARSECLNDMDYAQNKCWYYNAISVKNGGKPIDCNNITLKFFKYSDYDKCKDDENCYKKIKVEL